MSGILDILSCKCCKKPTDSGEETPGSFRKSSPKIIQRSLTDIFNDMTKKEQPRFSLEKLFSKKNIPTTNIDTSENDASTPKASTPKSLKELLNPPSLSELEKVPELVRKISRTMSISLTQSSFIKQSSKKITRRVRSKSETSCKCNKITPIDRNLPRRSNSFN